MNTYLEQDVQWGVLDGIATNEHRAHRFSSSIDAGLIIQALVSPFVYCFRILDRRLHALLACKAEDKRGKLKQNRKGTQRRATRHEGENHTGACREGEPLEIRQYKHTRTSIQQNKGISSATRVQMNAVLQEVS